MTDKAKKLLAALHAAANPDDIKMMSKFGINTDKVIGVRVPGIRKIAKAAAKGYDHPTALELWGTDIHEARILAGLLADPEEFTPQLVWEWTVDFNSWDIVDLVTDTFEKIPFINELITELAADKREFVRRTAFVIIAGHAVHNKKLTAPDFIAFFPLIEKYSTDDRNFVRKAVNWALRNIGKRNMILRTAALEFAENLVTSGNKTACWIAKDAIRELNTDKVIARIQKSKKA
ncbi:MAG: DNA alkylation repair protein [Lentisphaerae bacterium]|nr:DNA alkylation repair protein [Lentisphaerota bacterium]MCP4102139.1 DNA alkylation repair protein [Lentisphaerota bacterium]